MGIKLTTKIELVCDICGYHQDFQSDSDYKVVKNVMVRSMDLLFAPLVIHQKRFLRKGQI
jgi:hypothetical protein